MNEQRLRMNEQRLLETFFDLVKIDSVSRNEAEVAAYCKRIFESLNMSVHIDDAGQKVGSNTGNVIATLAGQLPYKLYFSAHMDTVSPGVGIKPYVEDSVIKSRSDTILGGDDKSGIAAIIEMLYVLEQSSTAHPTIVVMLSICEEVNLLGAQAMDAREFKGEPCYVLDANGKPGKVIIGAPYHYRFEACFNGVAAHAGVEPERGTSAIELATGAILGMELGRLSEDTTANIGSICGGSADNIVADSCKISGECRSLDLGKIEVVKDQLQKAMDAAVLGSAGSVNVEWDLQYKGYKVSPDDKDVQKVLTCAKALGLNACTEYTGGGSDANVFAHMGLSPIVLSTGMTNVHSKDEILLVQDLNDITKLCISIAFAGLDSDCS